MIYCNSLKSFRWIKLFPGRTPVRYITTKKVCATSFNGLPLNTRILLTDVSLCPKQNIEFNRRYGYRNPVSLIRSKYTGTNGVRFGKQVSLYQLDKSFKGAPHGCSCVMGKWVLTVVGAVLFSSLLCVLHVSKCLDSFKDFARNVFTPAKCLSIINPKTPNNNDGNPSLRGQYNFIADVVEGVSPAVVFIKSSAYFRQQTGSGFLISSDGLIVTNEHVVRHARDLRVQVQLVDGRTFTGLVQVVDVEADLALVKINGTNLPSLKLGDSSSLRSGEWVIALGSPLNLSNTVTSGIISSTARKSRDLGIQNEIDYLQTDAAITFGNSGGPLINLDGEAVGVNSMKVTDGISFAIPSDYVKKFISRADDPKRRINSGRSVPAYLGVTAMTLSPYLADQLRYRSDIGDLTVDSGVFIVNVVANSPAHQCGLKRFDVITQIDGVDIHTMRDLNEALKTKDVIKFTLIRGGRVRYIDVKLQQS